MNAPTSTDTFLPTPTLTSHQQQPAVRIVICGSAGDGRHTLLARLLACLLPDSTAARCEFVMAAMPGHAQVLRGNGTLSNGTLSNDMQRNDMQRNDMRSIVAAASTADIAVLVVDARNGFVPQTRRHVHLLGLLGLRHVVLAVNKMDLVDFDEAVFQRLQASCREVAVPSGRSGPGSTVAMPLCAVDGDTIAARSARTPWYTGPTLLQHLQTAALDHVRPPPSRPLRMPVQRVDGNHVDLHGYAGTLASGTVHVGQRVRVQPSGRSSTVARIGTAGSDVALAVAGQSVTLTLTDALAVSPGDIVSAGDSPAEVAGQFNATVVWLGQAPMLPGRGYLLQMGCKTVDATVLSLRHTVNIDTLEPMPAERLEQGEIGVVEISVDQPLAFDPHRDNKTTGGFALVDQISHARAGVGMLNFALRRAHNIHWQTLEVDKAARQRLAGHRSAVLWLTGLSGAGKSTIANLLDKRLHARGVRSYLLDGDNLRHGLNKDLGFTAEARAENIRRVAEVARLMVDAGVVVIAAFISPFRAERRMARELMGPGEFIEVFVDTPLAVAEQRDVKGLYKKARRGELKNFTGIDSPYEPPEAAEVVIDTTALSPADAAELLHARLVALGLLGLD